MAKKTSRRTTKSITRKELSRLEREKRQQRYLLFGIITVIILVLGIIAYGLVDQLVLKGLKPVADVRGQSITLTDYQTKVRYYRMQLYQQYLNSYQLYQSFGSELGASLASNLQQIQFQMSAENEIGLANDVLQQLIDDTLIAQEAEKLNIEIANNEVEEILQQTFNFYENGTPTPTSTATSIVTSTLSLTQIALITPTSLPSETLEPTLDHAIEETETPTIEPSPTIAEIEATQTSTPEPMPTSTKYTYESYQDFLTNYVEQLSDIDLTEQDLRDAIKAQLLRDAVMETITADLLPEEEQVWARHILLEDEDTAQSVLDRISASEDWSELAAEVSTDSSNNQQGGDLGWFGSGRMVVEFEDAAFELEIGEISDPVETEFGWHIIQVLGHEVRSLSTREFATIRQTKFAEWLESLKTEENIQIFDNWLEEIPSIPTIPPELIIEF
jgi:parvulin-like peptidyl-prolyl isomerase